MLNCAARAWQPLAFSFPLSRYAKRQTDTMIWLIEQNPDLLTPHAVRTYVYEYLQFRSPITECLQALLHITLTSRMDDILGNMMKLVKTCEAVRIPQTSVVTFVVGNMLQKSSFDVFLPLPKAESPSYLTIEAKLFQWQRLVVTPLGLSSEQR